MASDIEDVLLQAIEANYILAEIILLLFFLEIMKSSQFLFAPAS